MLFEKPGKAPRFYKSEILQFLHHKRDFLAGERVDDETGSEEGCGMAAEGERARFLGREVGQSALTVLIFRKQVHTHPFQVFPMILCPHIFVLH